MSGATSILWRGRAAALFTVGAVSAASVTYAVLGAVGLIPDPALYIVAAMVLSAYAAFWHVTGRSHVPHGRDGVQAKREWVMRGESGLPYFGAVLGVGLLTEMSTPFVYAGAAFAAGSGVLGGLYYGAAFGLGRATPTWAGFALGDRFAPAAVGLAFVENYRRLRLVGFLTGLAAVTVAASRLGLVP